MTAERIAPTEFKTQHSESKIFKAAVLDMYNSEPNRGMPMLRSMLGGFADDLDFEVFDVRAKHEVPRARDFDIFIFTGGPGDPLLDVDDAWDSRFYQLIDDIWQHNLQKDACRKYCFFICHSFQMACHHFKIGSVEARRRWSFGTYPVHPTAAGRRDPIFEGLADPFWIADFRRFEVVQPRPERLKELGASVLCLEKIRPHVEYERAVMAIRFSEEMVGTQFHPEADPDGMLYHFTQPERKKQVEEAHGEPTWNRMIRDLADPRKIGRTHDTVIPRFLETSLSQLRSFNK